MSASSAMASDWPEEGRIHSPQLRESSGIVRSEKHPGIFWTHNDSGHTPTLYAIRLSGEVVAEFRVRGAKNVDWEDIALAPGGKLLIGDIGDNLARRTELTIYEILEPDPRAEHVTVVTPTNVLRFSLPDGPADCEALFFHDGAPHIITKTGHERPVVYRITARDDGQAVVQRVCTVPLSPITAADVSQDGTRLALLSYGQLAVLDMSEGLAPSARREPQRVPFPLGLQTEGCCFDGDDVIITAESGKIWRITRHEIDRQQRAVDPSPGP